MRALLLLLWMTLLTGVIYPSLVALIALFAMPKEAKGSFVYQEGKVVGSLLIGQGFTKESYFWPRPSASDYQPVGSGASNLAPLSRKLYDEVEKRASSYGKSHEVPADLLFASASGLDPHISLEAAFFQVERISKARGVEASQIEKLIQEMRERRFLGFIGQRSVNVLKLNLALDELGRNIESR